jgi:hypothetical protein
VTKQAHSLCAPGHLTFLRARHCYFSLREFVSCSYCAQSSEVPPEVRRSGTGATPPSGIGDEN